MFVSFTLSQTGMVRHWNRHLATETDPAKRRHMIRSRAINTFGAFFTGLVLVVVLATKFTHGAWVALLGMVIFYGTMTAIRRHYDRVSEEIAAAEGPQRRQRAPLPGPLDRPGLQDPPADAARPRLRQADALRHPGGAQHQRRPGRDQGAAATSGSGAASTYR